MLSEFLLTFYERISCLDTERPNYEEIKFVVVFSAVLDSVSLVLESLIHLVMLVIVIWLYSNA